MNLSQAVIPSTLAFIPGVPIDEFPAECSHNFLISQHQTTIPIPLRSSFNNGNQRRYICPSTPQPNENERKLTTLYPYLQSKNSAQ